MPNVSAVIFAAKQLERDEVQGARVLDVGACDFNGSIRPLVEAWKPGEYLGVDILHGTGVDRICSADDLLCEFGAESFDIVLSLEMLEHSKEWKRSISNMKGVCRTGGLIILTTRSFGYPCHGFPDDFWRFEEDDLREIFGDCEITALERDPVQPGIFIALRKPQNFKERDLTHIEVFSMLAGRPLREVTGDIYHGKYFRRLKLKQVIRGTVYTTLFSCGRLISRILLLK